MWNDHLIINNPIDNNEETSSYKNTKRIRKHLIFEAYVDDESERPYRSGGIDREVSNAVIESVKLLHSSGFVHGDLRSPNIMIGNNNQMKFINFDWAGKEGEATYLMLLNTEIGWHNDVIAGGKIKSIHDEHIVKNELLGLMGQII
nr:14843_t:CDS:2 [Entrophospora candida]